MDLTQEELKNLEVIFSLARAQVVNDEKALVDVINFKKALLTKLTPTPEVKEEPKIKPEAVNN